MPESVELCLELQMDEDVKKILKSPERCRSAVLDVTVIKPKELEAFGTQQTNVLKAEQVRKLISSMEKQRREKQKLIENLKHDDTIIKVEKHKQDEDYFIEKSSRRKKSPEPRRNRFTEIGESVQPLFCEIHRSLKNVETRITSMKDLNLVISHTTTDETSSDEFMIYKNGAIRRGPNHLKDNYVYRAAKSEKDLKSILVCQNNRGKQTDGKCLCENCGIIGLLKECQKQPVFSSEPITDLPIDNKERRKLKSHYGQKPNEHLGQALHLDELYRRIKYLEERLSEQEEKLVPREYFKHIITKLVNNLTPKSLKSPTISECINTSPTEFKRFSPLAKKKETEMNYFENIQTDIDCFNLSSTPITKPTTQPEGEKRNDKSTTTEDFYVYSGNFWKWGEEILRPGIDLKNKIVTLVNEMLSKLSIPERMMHRRHEYDDHNEKLDSHDKTFKKLVNHMNTKVFNAKTHHYTNENQRSETRNPRIQEEISQRYVQNLPGDQSKKIDVAYVNPKISMWQKDSHTMNDAESCDLPKSSNSIGKDEFLKVLSRAKESQRLLLWKNIWEQAKANGQTIEDRINIKIPVLNKDGKMSNQVHEVEMSIGEVGNLLREQLAFNR